MYLRLLICFAAVLLSACTSADRAAVDERYDRELQVAATSEGTGEVRYVISRRAPSGRKAESGKLKAERENVK